MKIKPNQLSSILEYQLPSMNNVPIVPANQQDSRFSYLKKGTEKYGPGIIARSMNAN